MADVTKTVKDAAYVTVGLGVLAFQKAQVARRDLTKQVETQFTQTSEQVKESVVAHHRPLKEPFRKNVSGSTQRRTTLEMKNIFSNASRAACFSITELNNWSATCRAVVSDS